MDQTSATTPMDPTPQEKRLCILCKEFLTLDQFKPGVKKFCKFHYNIRHNETKRQRWSEDPRTRKASIIWQMAFMDSRRVFNIKLSIKPSEVQEIVASCELTDDVRMLPLDPLAPLSTSNFCVTTTQTRREICSAWRLLPDPRIYREFMKPEMKRNIFVTSENWIRR